VLGLMSLVGLGPSHHRHIDYNDISPLVRMTTIRLMLSIVAVEDLHLEQLDVQTMFFDGDLGENIYMVQPNCF